MNEAKSHTLFACLFGTQCSRRWSYCHGKRGEAISIVAKWVVRKLESSLKQVSMPC